MFITYWSLIVSTLVHCIGALIIAENEMVLNFLKKFGQTKSELEIYDTDVSIYLFFFKKWNERAVHLPASSWYYFLHPVFLVDTLRCTYTCMLHGPVGLHVDVTVVCEQAIIDRAKQLGHAIGLAVGTFVL